MPSEQSDIEEAAKEYAAQLEAERRGPHPFPWGRPHLLRGEGDGLTLYLGDRQGAPFVGLNGRGFHGWTSGPRWMPGGWEFMEPRIHIGRLFMDVGRSYSLGRILVPAKVWSFYYWRIKPSGRRYRREHPVEP